MGFMAFLRVKLHLLTLFLISEHLRTLIGVERKTFAHALLAMASQIRDSGSSLEGPPIDCPEIYVLCTRTRNAELERCSKQIDQVTGSGPRTLRSHLKTLDSNPSQTL